MLALAALSAGAFIFTMTLWLTRWGTVDIDTTQRLNRMKSMEDEQQKQLGSVSLRRRAKVSFGGINLVSGNIVQQWTVQLERAGLSLNAREYFILRITVGTLLTAVGMMLAPIPQLGLLGLPVGFLAVGFWVKRRISSRLHKLEAQLVELLQMLSSGLRAGFGLIQALDSASEQLPEPLAMEVRRMLRDTAMGASIDQSLQAMNERVGSPDFDIVITAILIQRTVGGNLAEILDNVAHTMRERERIRGEIRTLTSQQRMTGFVVGGIPVGLAIVITLLNPEFMTPMFTEPLGRMMLGGGFLLEVMGFFVISRIVNIEV
ncbi:MAG: type II secretion system F family protein [Dehalococcoidia bacterium]|nr:type II secretion system F family protein [Dehalococcoidia bacterium]